MRISPVSFVSKNYNKSQNKILSKNNQTFGHRTVGPVFFSDEIEAVVHYPTRKVFYYKIRTNSSNYVSVFYDKDEKKLKALDVKRFIDYSIGKEQTVLSEITDPNKVKYYYDKCVKTAVGCGYSRKEAELKG